MSVKQRTHGDHGSWWLVANAWLATLAASAGLAGVLSVGTAISSAAEPGGSHPLVLSYERFFRADSDQHEKRDDKHDEAHDAEHDDEAVRDEGKREEFASDGGVLAGQLLVAELNCVACHALPADVVWPVSAKSGPVLTEATSRLKPDFLRRLLANPHSAQPGTTMPQVGHALDDAARVEQAEALLHYLTSIGGHPEQQLPTLGSGQRGKELFHQVGCVACHGERRDEETPWQHAVPLGDLAAKYTLPGLTRFLLDPLHIRRDGRMPSFHLSSSEATEIAAFLLKLPEVARLRYDYYHGNWDRLPDFSQLNPVRSGGAEEISVDVARRRDRFGLRFQGYLRIDREGEYTFHLGSDDGSRLILDGSELIENDGIHPFTMKSQKIQLEPGSYPLVVEYFEQAGEESLVAEFEGPGVDPQPLGRAMAAERDTPTLAEEALTLELEPSRVAAGRTAFRALGCAACHEVREEENLVRSELAGPPLLQLNPSRGCLSENPDAGVLLYSLRDDQRAAVASALQWLRDGAKASGLDEGIHLSLATFQCYACHERHGRGGVDESIQGLFATTIPEMGDEGRLPPPLSGVGAKLTSPWLTRLLVDGSGEAGKDRPYMLARMPHFGGANVGHLVESFAAVDPLPAYPEQAPFGKSMDDVKEIGRVLVGEKGASCIKCHTFGRFASQGIQSMDLRIMGQRLRPEWFLPYLRNPQQFRPGTRMPSAWPLTGPSFFEEHFEGDSDRQVGAIWEYLADGERARIPSGMVTPAMELVPVDEAIIYRNFIEGAGPRAIGVGYPEGVHQAFDANELRIALLWEGRFIDASRHWSGRGQGFQPPAGDNFLSLPTGAPFARLADEAESWPTEPPRELGYRFLGYRLTPDQRPTFRYRYGDIEIEEFLETRNLTPGSPVPRRHTIRLDNAPNELWMRVAVGARIDDLGDGWYRVDNRWNVRLTASSSHFPVVRQKDGRQELVVKLTLLDVATDVTTEFAW